MGEAAEERAREKERKQPLEVSGGELSLTVSIGASTLAVAAKGIPNTGWDWDAVTITDEAEFAQAVLRELRHEEEDGTTLVHLMLDRAMLRAIENGCEGVQLKGDDA